MDDRSSPDRLRGDLLRRGLPRSYVRRVVGELADHRADLLAEGGPEAPGRLGDPRGLADLVASQYRRRTFLGRHPWLSFAVGVLTYVVAPISLLVLGSWLGAEFLFALAIGLRGLVEGHLGFSAFALFCRVLCLASFHVPLAGVAILAGRRAYRTGQGRGWLAASCLVLVALTGICYPSLVVSPIPGQSRYMNRMDPDPRSWHLLPMLVPVALGLALARRAESPGRVATA